MALGNKQIEIPDGLVALLDYDPGTGLLTWRDSRRGVRGGSPASSKCPRGYMVLKHKKIKYMAHRVIWKLIYGAIPSGLEIDHENTIKSDNRLKNLRQANKIQNGANRGKNRNNTSGFKGVTFCKQRRKWVAQINVYGKHVWLGYYATPEAAHQAYTYAASKTYGEYARAA